MKFRSVALLPAALLLSACNNTAPVAEPARPAQPADPVKEAPVEKLAQPDKRGVAAAAIKPVDIPAGYGYPGDRNEFQAWADAWEIDNITAAAWNLWAGITVDSGQLWNGAGLPVWETWCGSEEVFSAAGCTQHGRPPRAFERPRQIGHSERLASKPTPADTQVVSFNKFNPAMANYLATPHSQNGAAYSYLSATDLSNLNASWPKGTPVAEREVVDAPYTPDGGGVRGSTGIETKPVIFLVKAQGLSPIPLWMGPKSSKEPQNATPETWFTCVLLDPSNDAAPDTRPVPATPQQVAQIVPNSGMACKTYLYAPLSTIYNFKMDAQEADAWNRVQGNSDVGSAAAGDYGVLVGMHVNSKAIVNWTWETFWWQPGDDAPDNFPGSKQGMTTNITGAWRNYAMCTAWNQTKGNASRNMVVCFNPFLETSSSIPAGQTSNCMSCHGTATVGALATQGLSTMGYPADYKAPLDFNSNVCTRSSGTTCFADFTRTDFSWAIPGNALLPPSAATRP